MRCPKLPELKATKNATGWYFFIVYYVLILVENYVVLKMQLGKVAPKNHIIHSLISEHKR